MSQDHWAKIAQHFHRINELQGQAQIAALALLEAEHPAIFTEVKQLLAEEKQLLPALHTAAQLADTNTAADRQLIGQQIGPYRLLDYIGGGGMGSVFLAERADGVFDRKVALKLIRSSYQTEKSLSRFRNERQILARLQHPHIAQIYDGGTHKDGRLYFSMEYIQGETLMKYCSTQQLNTAKRLDLFEQIAEAISYAHQQLVLHIDIKPSNVVVEANGRLKVVDFGIAKIIEEADASPNQSLPFTLAYAAPEQIQRQNSSTATDIYALGVLLYQLLSEQLPFDRRTLSRALYSNSHAREQAYEQAFQLPPPGAVQGDYYHICAKAIQTDISARYSSVDQMIADVRAARHHYPISIKKHLTSYSLGKFLMRNRGKIASLSILGIALLLTVVFYTLALQKERNQAQLASTKSNQLLGLITSMFESADPFQAQNDTLPVSYFLDQASLQLEKDPQVDPILSGDLNITLANVYNSLGNYPKADSLAQKALLTYNTSTLSTEEDLGKVYQSIASIKYSFGEYLASDSLYQLALTYYGNQKTHYSEKADCYISLGHLQIETGDYPKADSLYQLAYDYYSQVYTAPHEDLAAALHGRGNAKRKQEIFAASNRYYQEALAMQNQLFTAPNTEIAYTLNHLASLYYDQFQYNEGILFARQSFEQRLAIFGPNHVETIASQSNLSRFYAKLGRYEEALQIREELYLITKAVLGDRLHPYVLGQSQAIANLNRHLGRWEIAAEKYLGLLDDVKQLPYPYRLQYVLHQGYGNTLIQLHQLQAAEKHLRSAFDLIQSGTQRVFSGDEITIRYDLAICLSKLNKKAEANRLMQEAKALLADYPDLPLSRLSKINEF